MGFCLISFKVPVTINQYEPAVQNVCLPLLEVREITETLSMANEAKVSDTLVATSAFSPYLT